MGAAQRGRELGDAVALFYCADVAFGQVWLFILVGVSGGGVVALQLEGSSARSSCTKFPCRLRFAFLAALRSQSWESWLSRTFSCSLLCSLLALSPSLYEEPASFGWPGRAERPH